MAAILVCDQAGRKAMNLADWCNPFLKISEAKAVLRECRFPHGCSEERKLLYFDAIFIGHVDAGPEVYRQRSFTAAYLEAHRLRHRISL